MTDEEPSGNEGTDGGDAEEGTPTVKPASDPLREMADQGEESDVGGPAGEGADGGSPGPHDGSGGGDPGDDDGGSFRSPSRLVLALLAGLAGFAGSYAAVGASRGYLLAPFSDLLAEYTPSIVFQFFRNELGSTLQKLLAGSMAAAFLAVGVLAALYVAERTDRPWSRVPLAAVFATGLAFLATTVPLASVAAGVAAAVVVGVAELVATVPVGAPTNPGRRRVLAGVAAAAGAGLLGREVGNRVSAASAGTTPTLSDGEFVGGTAGNVSGDVDPNVDDPTLVGIDQDRVMELLDEAERKSFDVAGIEPLVSREFYSVDINTVDPEVEVEDWSLSVTGEVANEVTYDYREIRNMEHEHRFVSLRCVSDDINGDAMDNALWTGVPANRILDAAGPQGDYVLLHGVDDYSVGFPLEALRGGLFAYGMNGKVLPQAHGFPLRTLVPGHWGETNAKWIDEIEVTTKEVDGYWESRGWAGTGPVHTVAKLKSVERPEDGRVEVAGHAYAGLRGISAVEVSIDGGETWTEAELSESLPGEDVWRQWRHEYDAPGETHQVVVRAVEADGTVQPEEGRDAFPSGATGWVSKTVSA